MAIFYSAATGGFYDDAIHAVMPDDAAPVTAEDHAALIEAQATGAVIQPDAEGRPCAVTPAPPTPEAQLAAARSAMRASRFQARAALHLAGLLPQVEAAVAVADPLVQIAWADASEFRRDSPAIAAIADALGMDDLEIDHLFRQAAAIRA